MKLLFAIFFATVYGLFIRVMFGVLENFMGIMTLAFCVLVPGIIGYLTIFWTRPESTESTLGAFFKPWLTSLAILVITILLNIEGTVCWVMIFPFFAVLAGLGGVVAYHARQGNAKKKRETRDDILDDFDQPGKLQISLLMVLPLVFGLLEGDRTQVREETVLKKSVIVEAPAAQVWEVLTQLEKIKPEEKQSDFAIFLGLPKHLRTEIDSVAVGGRRTAIFENGLFFEEKITEIDPRRRLALALSVDPAKIPPTVLDEHIVIGGRHFDVHEDIYRLEDLPGGRCRFELSGRFSICTPFNWYAGIWADYMMGDILESMVELIKTRAEGNMGHHF